MNVKTLKSIQSISFLDKLRTRIFQFHVQRWVIFFAVFAISFLIIWDFNFFDGPVLTRILKQWPSLAWRFFLLFAVYSSTRPLVKFIAESFNRNIYAWIATLIAVGYLVCLYVFTKDSAITDLHSIKLEYFAWMLPSIALPIILKGFALLLTRKISPLQFRKTLLQFFGLIAFAAIPISGALIFYYDFVVGIKFDITEQKYALLISFAVLGFIFGTLFAIVAWWRFRKIKFSNQNISVPLIVTLPIFTTILVWMFKGTFSVDLNMSPEMWFLVAISILVGLVIIFTLFFAKEVRVAKVMNAIYSSSLVAIWIGVFTFVNYFGLVDDSYVVVDIAAAGSLAIFILMAIFDRTTKMGAVQETIFSVTIFVLMILIIFFTIVGKAHLFDELLKFAPVDLKSLLPVLLIAMPGLYFVMSIIKILWAQSRITHGIRIEKNIKKRKAIEAELAIGDNDE